MARTKLYAGIYVVLFVLATLQVVVERVEFLGFWQAFGLIMALSMVKAVAVAGYYQHLRWEPRSLTYLMLVGLGAALALTLAAGYSIV